MRINTRTSYFFIYNKIYNFFLVNVDRVSLTNINMFPSYTLFQKLKYCINLNINGKNRYVNIFFLQ